MAAAIGAGLPIEEPLGNMVVDIGGGTTEVAVISLSAVAYSESVRVAGDEMNDSIQRYVQNKYQMLIGENMAETLKKKVGAALPLKDSLTCRLSGKYLVNGSPKSVEISDREVSEAIREPVNAIVSAVGRALDKTPPELISDILDQGVLLAGGGALLKGLDQLIAKKLQLKVIVDQEPLTTVVRGTGITLNNMKKFSEVYIN